MKYTQFLLIIFCLGIFLIPKNNFYTLTSQENCCNTESNTHSCCEKDDDSHDKKNGESSCNDDCCSLCMTCHNFVENLSAKTLFFNHTPFKTDKSLEFQYSDPHISDSLKDIWQPPKLG
ncbi:hypothetical protein EAG08_09900 [Chryseobacterium sp. 3008163]|nr:hypothetical protein EAG08_09900 [Chryseobacterium sp. 3008163]